MVFDSERTDLKSDREVARSARLGSFHVTAQAQAKRKKDGGDRDEKREKERKSERGKGKSRQGKVSIFATVSDVTIACIPGYFRPRMLIR